MKAINKIKFILNKFPNFEIVIRILVNKLKTPITIYHGTDKVLICYITRPFKKYITRSHTNEQEVMTIAKTFNKLGYGVDVIDYNAGSKINYSKYKIIFGFGDAYKRSFCDSRFVGKRILHLTGANPNFSNFAEAKRAKYFFERHQKFIITRRRVYWDWIYSLVNSDAVFVLGNEWTLSTYKNMHPKLFLLPVPCVALNLPSIKEKNYNEGRKNFCWFAGSGALHKGLDLVLDAIETLGDDFHLDVCGPISNETDFIAHYEECLFDNPKITYHGFVDVDSEKMISIILNNNFVIMPSCSEGGGSSVITCMSGGLIPIVTPEASVNIGNFGFLIPEGTVESTAKMMLKASSEPSDKLKKMSLKASEYAKLNHNYHFYAQILNREISNLL
jgi:hypothetical protein